MGGGTKFHHLLLSGGAFTAPTTSLFIANNFTNTSGTFNANGGTVNFEGTGMVQTITGATTFNNLSKTVASPQTLTFGVGAANRSPSTPVRGPELFTP